MLQSSNLLCLLAFIVHLFLAPCITTRSTVALQLPLPVTPSRQHLVDILEKGVKNRDVFDTCDSSKMIWLQHGKFSEHRYDPEEMPQQFESISNMF